LHPARACPSPVGGEHIRRTLQHCPHPPDDGFAGYYRPTVSKIVEQLIANGLIEELKN